MEMILIHPTYFSPILQYVYIVKAKKLLFEVEDNYQKQTYRNRCYINTANGQHALNIPIQHHKGVKQKTNAVKIDYKYNWDAAHIKTLKTAYNSSPFFEFYIDDLLGIFKKRTPFLLDLNIKCHEFIMDCLQIDIPYSKTSQFDKTPHNALDLRHLALAKAKNNFTQKPYYQVFSASHGFQNNLSILDLLFMEGPNALNYLENQSIQF